MKAFDVALEKHVAEDYGLKKMFATSSVPIKVEDAKNVGDAIMLKGSKLQLTTAAEMVPENQVKSETEKVKENF